MSAHTVARVRAVTHGSVRTPTVPFPPRWAAVLNVLREELKVDGSLLERVSLRGLSERRDDGD